MIKFNAEKFKFYIMRDMNLYYLAVHQAIHVDLSISIHLIKFF